MANFSIAYNKYILPFEGGYVNHADDKGGETYAGIARNFHPTWEGWKTIDAIKQGRTIKRNEKFPTLNNLVTNFFLDLWNKNRFGEIKSQDVANIFYDFYINSEKSAIKKVQEILKVSRDGVLGSNTLAAINNLDAAKLYNTIKDARIKFYETLVKNNPSQSVFLKGWMNRINSFPTLVVTGSVTIFILIGLFVFLLTLKK
jgi:lysozyme family protein